MISIKNLNLSSSPVNNPTPLKLKSKTPPLVHAVKTKDFSKIEQLILNNASPFEKDATNFSAIDYSVFLNQESTLPQFFGIESEKFIFAKSAETSYEQVKNIIHQAKKIAEQSNLVIQNIYAGNISSITHFFESSKYSFDHNPIQGLTAMHFAACGNAPEMIELLHNNGYNLEAQDHQGRTPLHYASLNKNKKIFTQLVKLGSNPLAQDHLKVSPLDLLVVESKKKDPLEISMHSYLNLSLLVLLSTYYTYYDYSLIPGELRNTFHLTAFYITQFAELSLILKGNSFSVKKALASAATLFAMRQFTITRILLNAFILSKLTFSTFFKIRQAFFQYSVRPKETIKKISATILEPALFGFLFARKYTFDFLKDCLNDLSKTFEGSFSQTELGEETLDEYEECYLFFSKKIECLTNYFGI